MNDQMPVETPKNNTPMIVGVVAVVLCCLCVIISGVGWYVWNNF